MFDFLAFYKEISETEFTPSAHTAGPWSDATQHAGPPSALLGRAIEKVAAGLTVLRFTANIFKPVPVRNTVHVATEVVRKGKSLSYIAATLTVDGEVFIRAVALCVRQKKFSEITDIQAKAQGSRPAPPRGEPFTFPQFLSGPVGYHSAMQMELVEGVHGAGPTTMWFRQRVPLVLGETSPSGLQRALVVADSGNGISFYAHPLKVASFVNPDLCVVMHRAPRGEWVGVQARTENNDVGSGVAYTELFDSEGPCGRGSQVLFVASRL